MENIKRITPIASLLLIAWLAFTHISCAQNERRQGPPPIPDAKAVSQMVDDLANELDLTATQKVEVNTIFTNHFDGMRDIREQNQETGEKPDRKLMEKEKQAFENNVKAVLNKDQQKQFDSYMENLRSEKGSVQGHKSKSGNRRR